MPISGKFPPKVDRGSKILASDFNFVSNELRRLGSIGDSSQGVISTGAGVFRRSIRPKTAPANTLQIVRFSILSGNATSVLATTESKSCGLNIIPGDIDAVGSADGIIEVYDPAGCFFDELESVLIGRQGFAAWLELQSSNGTGTGILEDDCRWEVFSLCCPP